MHCYGLATTRTLQSKAVIKLLIFIFAFVQITWVQGQTEPETIRVEGGTFKMGDDNGEKDEKPTHSVTIRSFNLARTETTVGQWREFCAVTARRMPEVPWFGQKETQPIVNVSWDDAVAYCHWLSSKTDKHYRLPTEAEWEFAARGGTKSKGYPYSGGTAPDSVSWFSGKTVGPMHVATKLPNELGFYDMTGNVWEWCSDFYDAGYYGVSDKENPTGPAQGKFYSIRGGAWDIGAKNCRITYRNALAPSSRNHNKGFRVARD